MSAHGGRRILGAALVATTVAACLPAAVTAEGREIDRLYGWFVILAAFVFILVYGLATFAILRSRFSRRRDTDEPRQVRGNNLVEAIWTGIPLLVVLGLFAGTLAVLARTEARSEAPAAEIHVHGFRWGWTFRYPAEGIEVAGVGPPGPEVVVPVGRPVRYVLTADDVLHSWFVPQFLFKRDAIPGRTHTFDITVEEPGSYGGQCAEFCGIGHAAMPFRIRAVSESEYAAWLEDQRAEPTGAGAAGAAGATPSLLSMSVVGISRRPSIPATGMRRGAAVVASPSCGRRAQRRAGIAPRRRP